MWNLKREVRDIKRFNQIFLAFAKEGLHVYFPHFGLIGIFCKRNRSKEREKPEERLRKVLEKLGPTFIKFGQILSLRPDKIPKEYVRELSKLQDEVPPFPYSEAVRAVENETGGQIKEVFSEFGKQPIASASISQVYRAKLISGDDVAVKVQRPKVREMMKTDIEIMYFVAKHLEKYSEKIAKYSPVEIVREFEEWTMRELDFRNEARNAKKLLKNSKKLRFVKIPYIFDKYSTDRLLVMEFIDGIELRKIKELKKKKYNIKKVIMNGFEMALTQVFEDGFFHADPHPANILVLKNNDIALVDFGIVGYFDEELKRKSIELFYGVVENDVDLIADAFASMGLVDKKITDVEKFKNELKKAIEPMQKSRLKDVKVSHVLEDVLDTALHNNVKMPISFVLFGKALVTIEGVGLEYDPDFTLTEEAKPFVEKLINKGLLEGYMRKSLSANIKAYKKFFGELPERVNAALGRIEKGTIKVDVEDTDVKRLGLDIDRSSNRLTYGVLIAALLITGALLKDVGEQIYLGFPLVSLLCFGIAFILATGLLVSIMKEGK